MVDLMLQHASVIPRGLEIHRLSRAVERPHADGLEPRHHAAPEKRRGKAPLGVFLDIRPDGLVGRVEKRRERDLPLSPRERDGVRAFL